MNTNVWLRLALTLTMLMIFASPARAQQGSERNMSHPPAPTCRMDAAGMCGGACPNGQLCQKKGPGVCGCAEATTCGLMPGTKMCGGACKDSRMVCQQVGDQPGKCDCRPPNPPPVSTCAFDPKKKMCGGTCVGVNQGKVCRQVSPDACRCMPAT